LTTPVAGTLYRPLDFVVCLQTGVYVPLDDADRVPSDLRREVSAALGKYLAKALARQGVSARKLKEDFSAYRRRRR
jgi:hypothetical protein